MSRGCRSCDKSFRPEGSWQRLCWPCWRELRQQAAKPRAVVSADNAQLLWSAIALCHAEKHLPERAELCNRVTAALLEALEAVREAA